MQCQNVQGVEQTINKVDNIYYERIEHAYLTFVYSSVII